MAEFYRRFRCRTQIPGTQESGRALQDAQRALGLLRSKADEWNLEPERIGVLGFSAGGHLSATLSNHWRERKYQGSIERTMFLVDRTLRFWCIQPTSARRILRRQTTFLWTKKRLQLSSYRPKTTLGIFPARLPTTASYLKGESKWNCIRSRPAVMAMDCVLQRIQFLDGKIFAAIGC